MSECGEVFRQLKDHKKRVRAAYGVECPVCKTQRPKGNATILLPQQRCRMDKYQDPRPYLTDEQYSFNNGEK